MAEYRLTSTNVVIHFENGHEHCKNDAHHEEAHHNYEQWTQQADERAHHRVELAFLVGGGALQHGIELAARFARRYEVHRHGWKQLAVRQRTADGRTFADARGGGADRVAHRQVGDHFTGNTHGLEHRDRARRQDAEGAGETGGVEAAHQASEQRQPQLEAMEPAPVLVVFAPVDESGDRRDDGDEQIDAIVAQEIADEDQDLRGHGQLALARLEHLDHFRDDVHHHACHDAETDDRQHDRVEHGAEDLLARDLAVLGVVGQSLEHA